jgi:hypothetical protein
MLRRIGEALYCQSCYLRIGVTITRFKGELPVNFAHANVHGLKLVVATALAWSALTSLGFAYTPEQQQRCQGDAMRLCGEFIPDVDRITACMIAKKSQLSEGCRAVFNSEPTQSAAASYPPGTRPAKPLNIAPNR